MHDLLFSSQSEWSALTEDAARAKMSEYAKSLQLDVARFDRELADGTYQAKVEAQSEEGVMMGLPGTPSFISTPSCSLRTWAFISEPCRVCAVALGPDKFFQSPQR
jgi:hypothetical protein